MNHKKNLILAKRKELYKRNSHKSFNQPLMMPFDFILNSESSEVEGFECLMTVFEREITSGSNYVTA